MQILKVEGLGRKIKISEGFFLSIGSISKDNSPAPLNPPIVTEDERWTFLKNEFVHKEVCLNWCSSITMIIQLSLALLFC